MSTQDLSLDPTKRSPIKPGLLPWLLMGMRSTTLAVKFIFTFFVAQAINLDALGIYGLILAAGIVSPAILGLGIMHFLSRSAVQQPAADTKADLKNYLAYISVLFFGIGIASLVYFALQGQWLLALIILLIILFEHLNGEFYQLMISLSRPVLADSLHFIRSASWILVYMLIATLWPAFRNIESLLIAWLAGTGFCTLVYFWVIAALPAASKSPAGFKNWMKKSCKQSSWLYLNGIATTGANYSDRYLIGALLNLELTGLYVFFWQIQSALSNLIYTGIIQVARPAFVRNFSQAQPDWKMVKTLFKNTALVAIIFFLLALIAIQSVIHYLPMPLIADYYGLFVLILIAFAFNVIAEAQVLVFYGKYKDHLVSLITLVVFAVNLVSCICTISWLGLWGAGISAIFSALTRMSLQAWFIARFKAEQASGGQS